MSQEFNLHQIRLHTVAMMFYYDSVVRIGDSVGDSALEN